MSISQETIRAWDAEIDEFKHRHVYSDLYDWQERVKNDNFEGLKYLGGLDISYVKGSYHHATVCFVILDANTLQLIFWGMQEVMLYRPYKAHYLGSKEGAAMARHVHETIKEWLARNPHIDYAMLAEEMAILVDGSGIWHKFGFGSAAQIGVRLEILMSDDELARGKRIQIATIGVAKNYLYLDGSPSREQLAEMIRDNILQRTDADQLAGNVRMFDLSCAVANRRCSVFKNFVPIQSRRVNPIELNDLKLLGKLIFVSAGHAITLETASRLAHYCSNFKIPEPVRLADLLSRDYNRENLDKRKLIKTVDNNKYYY